ncbi:endo-1,4-beta-xylanase [Caulobacter sp. BK020]|uniref:endo-1,4-beta-xylanase n=1 Tax=Caulobacter sp. BK020 TaxID=2512117 RepID=UPI0010442BB4|nr:endo-1,4-beta-xylanase [Caulobacter sp. BK020]
MDPPPLGEVARRAGGGLGRRTVLAGALALSACGPKAQSQPIPADLPPLRSVAPFRVGACVQALHLDDPALAALLVREVSQLTPEWQMKMEYIVQPDGSFRFEAPDRIAAFARAHGMGLLGHNLVWYAQTPEAFQRLDENRIGFADAYRNYIHAVAGRYRGQVVGWDVVNEPVAEDGNGWRDSLWAQRLGAFEHIALAYRTAHEADPDAVLLLNDYNLEYFPKKRATYLNLAERLLASGAPLTGLGAQMHVAADVPPGEITRMIRDLASLGLPIHVSELDVSLTRAENKLLSRAELQRRQTAVYAEAAEAFMALPERQRFAFTLWGLRDRDSWLRAENAADAPAVFDDAGRPKAGAAALVDAFQGRRPQA